MNYESRKSIVILHGWGLAGKTYAKLMEFFRKGGFNVYAPDLPGFGMEPLKKTMNLDDYVYFVHNFIKERKLEKVILVGHSFGGRVAIKYAWKYPENVSQLILTGVPIIRRKSFMKQLAFFAATVGGKFFSLFPIQTKEFLRKSLYFMIGEWDYYKSGPLKQLFKNVIGENLIPYAKEVKVATLLIWGEDDRIVPSSDIEKIKKYMPQTKSVIVPNVGHKLPYEDSEIFYKKVLPFIK